MQRHVLLVPALGLLLLLGACPDSKLPTPPPKVPVPKAEPQALKSPSMERFAAVLSIVHVAQAVAFTGRSAS